MSLKKLTISALIGPTGIGKTALALEWAKRTGGEIISCDSVAVYQKLNIGSAKPTAEQRLQAVFHLLDVVSPVQDFTVKDYVQEVEKILLSARTEVPLLLVGGSTFYWLALTHGMFSCPATELKIEQEIEQEIEQSSLQHMHNLLVQQELQFFAQQNLAYPQALFKIHPHDRYRIVRALAVLRQTGKPITWYKLQHQQHLVTDTDLTNNGSLIPNCRTFTLNHERTQLYQNINQRVDQMIESGLIEETQQLLSAGVSLQSKALGAIGYKEVCAWLNSNPQPELSKLKEQIAQNTRHYAKRQVTWLRGQKDILWVSEAEFLSASIASIASSK